MTNTPTLKFKRLPHGEGLPLPAYATPGSAGMDICAAARVTLPRGRTRVIPTGFSVEIPEGYELQVRPRSGLAVKFGATVLNSPGTIDSDYRGEIKIALIGHGSDAICFDPGDRIAQLVLAPVIQPTIVEVSELGETERGEGGFGSTGGIEPMKDNTNDYRCDYCLMDGRLVNDYCPKCDAEYDYYDHVYEEPEWDDFSCFICGGDDC